MMLKIVFAAFPFAVALQAQTPAATSRPNPASMERLLRPAIRLAGMPDTTFDIVDRMRYWHVPGVSIAIIDDFRIVYARGFGVAEFGANRLVDTTTLFQAGSISKPVFATGMLKLVEQGRVSLDEDVNAKLTSWKVPESRFTEREKVTLRRVLTHSAGLTVWGFPGYAATASVPTVPQVLDGTPPANTPAVRPDTIPGTFWRYSGGGFTIAQLLASDVAGEPFHSLMRRLVLAPSGMTRSTYENPIPSSHFPHAASGHERIDTPVPGRFHTYPEMAAAGLWTTAPELARWALALTRSYNGDRNSVLSPETAKQMVSKQVAVGQQYGGGHFGLGVVVSGEGDSVAFSHNGRDEGFVAAMAMMPKLGRGYVILTNGVSGPFLTEVRRAFAEVYGMAGPRPERKLVDVDTATLRAYLGKYEFRIGTDTNVLDVSVDRGALMMFNTMGKRWLRLWPVARDTYFDANNGSIYVFEREGGEGSAVKAIRLGMPGDAQRALRK